ncbi:DUF485 domain-containing protein [Pseudomonas sp. 21615526]|uniref:DUF485 domain-containing protein n=1 Tax=unclassified Pseudomonas TaxID=196821 RepID=UPI0015BDCEBB|nr:MULTISPECIES: DUF485 domain-containing protein [unclassified Pseudomonas]NVZ37606.1 DUF485 domain-containing protein [Pseudomonas sp. 21615526]NWD00787.1 DUF485 domain-containing protein [Pseudomonas sp. P7779]
MQALYPQDGDPAVSANQLENAIRSPILDSPDFRGLVKQRRRFSWSMSLLMLTVYFGFILSLAFMPERLGTPIIEGQPITWGIPVGFGMFAFTTLLVAIYVWRTTTCYDPKIKKIIRIFHT